MNNDTNEIWPGDSKKLNISNILTIKSKQCNGKGAFVGKCLHRKMFAWKCIHMQNNGPIKVNQKIAVFGSEISVGNLKIEISGRVGNWKLKTWVSNLR